MKRLLYPSVDAMLAPESLSELEGRSVTTMRCLPFDAVDSYSGSHFLAVETDGAQGRRYILKRIAYESDWIMRATDDRCGRVITAWQTGLFDRLPPEIEHSMVAGAVDGTGWAILMRDYRDAFIPPGDQKLSIPDHKQILDALAALHETFWEEPAAADPALGFCNLRQRYLAMAPRTLEHITGVPAFIAKGWEDVLDRLLEPDVSQLLHQLLEDPEPLCHALGQFPHTVVHGDLWTANLGLLRQPRKRVIIVDWAFVGPAPPSVDLAYYLASVIAARLPVSKQEAIDYYRQRLFSRLQIPPDNHWWKPQLELGLLGAFLQIGRTTLQLAAHGATEDVRHRARADLDWWSKHIRAAACWL